MSKEAMKLALEALLPKAIWNESIEGVFDLPLNEAAHAVVAIRKALADQTEPVQYTYASKQATMCAGCGEHKHTPLRIDAMGGYVCLTCIDKKLGSLLGEFDYPESEQPAQPQQKPVAWMYTSRIAGGNQTYITRYASELTTYRADKVTPLYTSPPAQRTWVGLTDEEMDDCWNKLFGTGNYNRRNVYRAIEAKLKEKNT